MLRKVIPPVPREVPAVHLVEVHAVVVAVAVEIEMIDWVKPSSGSLTYIRKQK
jgi:hypothetical protein